MNRELCLQISAQKTELIALTRALELSEKKKTNTKKPKSTFGQTQSAFGVIHTHETIWRGRGLLSAQGATIQHAEHIL